MSDVQPSKLPPVGEGGDFQIGGEVWPGLAKVVEECGELLQVIGKVIAYPDTVDHPDGTENLPARLLEELADATAAIEFVVRVNAAPLRDVFNQRIAYKIERFEHWHTTILNQQS